MSAKTFGPADLAHFAKFGYKPLPEVVWDGEAMDKRVIGQTWETWYVRPTVDGRFAVVARDASCPAGWGRHVEESKATASEASHVMHHKYVG